MKDNSWKLGNKVTETEGIPFHMLWKFLTGIIIPSHRCFFNRCSASLKRITAEDILGFARLIASIGNEHSEINWVQGQQGLVPLCNIHEQTVNIMCRPNFLPKTLWTNRNISEYSAQRTQAQKCFPTVRKVSLFIFHEGKRMTFSHLESEDKIFNKTSCKAILFIWQAD